MVDQKRLDKRLYWDRALSLVEGCTPMTPACDHCWSAAQTHMRAGQAYPKMRARYGGLTNEQGRFNGRVREMWDDLKKPPATKRPTVWAVWNDLFHIKVSTGLQDAFFDMARATPWHTYLLLTKRHAGLDLYLDDRPTVAGDLAGPLAHVWFGVTLHGGASTRDVIATVWALSSLYRIKTSYGGHTWISAEPLLGPVNLGITFFALDAVVAGGETGAGARPTHGQWLRDLRDECAEAGVKFFFKRWGPWYWVKHLSESAGWDAHHWPDGSVSYKIGSRRAGYLLDGVEWSELAW